MITHYLLIGLWGLSAPEVKHLYHWRQSLEIESDGTPEDEAIKIGECLAQMEDIAWLDIKHQVLFLGLNRTHCSWVSLSLTPLITSIATLNANA